MLEVTICWICCISSLSSIIIRACLRIDAATGTLYAAGVIVTPVPHNAEWQIAEIDIMHSAAEQSIRYFFSTSINSFPLLLSLHEVVVNKRLYPCHIPMASTLILRDPLPVILLPSVVTEV